MPFCPQCGAQNPASARFCDQCGAQMIPLPAQTLPPAPSPAPPPPARPVPPVVPASPGVQQGGVAVASPGPSVCPQCGTSVIPGEAFCDNCGAALLGSLRPSAPAAAPALPFGGVPAQPTYPPPQPVTPAPQPRPVPQAPPPPPPVRPAPPVVPASPPPVRPAPPPPRTILAPAVLIMRANNARLSLPPSVEAIIGRADPVSNFFPDLDLTPYGAVEHGVGRRHARIFVHANQIYLEDLDSTNGTFRNNARLTPRQPVPLINGDELRLGRLVVTIQL
ncbi:MAG: FHA domain-containing protein [Chloroflexia bacterium]|nr:FHA domain-containing protein [Chloroflexia bacterium]